MNAQDNKQAFDVTGMTCAACSSRVDTSARKVDGVADVSVNLLKNSMQVTYEPGTSAEDMDRINNAIMAEVAKAGYGATVRVQVNKTAPTGKSNAQTAHEAQLKIARETELSMRKRLIISIVFCVPLFYLAMGHMLGWPLPFFFTGHEYMMVTALTQLLLTVPIVFVNFKFFSNGFKSLFHLAPNMDALVAIGAAASICYSIYQMYLMAIGLGAGESAMTHEAFMSMYFESAGVILTLIMLGKYFEARAKGRTTDAISALIDLMPKTATVLNDGLEEVVPIEQVAAGDVLVVRAGETVPLDGIIVNGNASIDESTITGESVPVEKQAGDIVTGATISRSGYFTMRVTHTGDETVLAGIIALVDEATSSKAPIQNTADKIAGVFVPIVIFIAIAVLLIWLLLGAGVEAALNYSISVLVISCPCALGLATPTAIMVGTGRGASRGILIKSADALEAAGQAKTVIFDKTGTITQGTPRVIGLEAVDADELLSLAFSIEEKSEHPLAQAIVRYAEKKGIVSASDELEDFTQIPGGGLSAMLDGKPVLAGNARMMQEQGIDISSMQSSAESYANQGATPLYFALDGKLIGLIAVADSLKPTSRSAMIELENMGLTTIILTGDNERTAHAIQKACGAHECIASVLPDGKEREVSRLQENGPVIMVGDGVNDAPALARADVGIAIGNGTDIAIESADIVLMRSDPLDVVTAIQLSRRTLRTIRQNLFWALIYNVICIPIAAGLFSALSLVINPMIAAAAMGASSLFVVANALRLRTWKPKLIYDHSADDASTSFRAESRSGETSTSFRADARSAEVEKSRKGSLETQHEISPLGPSALGRNDVEKGSSALGRNDVENEPTALGRNDVKDEKGTSMEKKFKVDGMMCQNCVRHVKNALEGVDGVDEAIVNLEAGTATALLNKDIDDDILISAIEEEGYPTTKL